MELLESTISKINIKIIKNITGLILVHCNIVNNENQQDSRVLYTFVPNKSFCQLLDISSKNIVFLKTHKFHILKYGLLIKILNL